MASTIIIVIVLFAFEAESVVRESFPMDADVAWVVQVSDLHLSAYHPERAADLVHLLSPALTVIRPSLLLFTGDITDAKNKRRTSTRQDISEWIQYRNSVEAIVNYSGLEKRRIFDTRGNHDKYGVPNVGHELDFFSIHSVSSQLGRLSTIQSISLVGNDRNYFFIGIDDTLSIGIRGPSNLFGHPTETRIAAVESELQYLDTYPGTATKIIFGHFPLSFTASSRKGQRYENVFARQSVSSYICGHLHGKFSRQLWRLHSDVDEKKVMSFWEWELGDWKDSRLIRILAIDRGEVSFLDVELRKYQAQEDFDTTILITYPVDSRNMNKIKQNKMPVRNDINALVFSAQQIINVTARVFDSFREYKIVEEVPLQHIRSATDKPLFHGKWNAEGYRSASATRYLLQVSAFDSQGKVTRSNFRPFSVDENSAVRLHHCGKSWCRSGHAASHIASEQVTQLAAVVPSKSLKGLNTSVACKICNRWTRMFLLLGCLVTLLIHLKLCLALMLAYGAGPVALSPALSWAPPLFIVVAVYSTRANIDSKQDDK